MHKVTREQIERAPKGDLHTHLDGSVRLPTLIELARAQNIELPSYDPDGLRELVFKKDYADLPDYLRGFNYTCAVMRDREAAERIAYELGADAIAEGIRYMEVRFAPQLLIDGTDDAVAMFRAVGNGLERAAAEHRASLADDDMPFAFGIICCAMRSFNRQMSGYYHHLFKSLSGLRRSRIFSLASLLAVESALEARDRHGVPVVGFDLAGEEAGYRAGHHAEAFQRAHAGFLRKTVHAGEAYGPESIYEAVTACLAERIGHGTSLFYADAIRDGSIRDRDLYVRRLVEYIASRRITIEVCPTSNLQTMPSLAGDLANHPVRRMIENQLSVTIATDNRLVSRTTLTDELLKVIHACNLGATASSRLLLAAFKAAFHPGSYAEKRAFTEAARQRITRALRTEPPA